MNDERYGKPVFYDSKEEYDMVRNTDRLNGIERDIRDIKDNHLKSIYDTLDKVRERTMYILGILVVAVPVLIAVLIKVW